MASLREVAAAAGVSTSVASRALNGRTDSRMAAETRERVLRIAAELEYVPNQRSRNLRFSRSQAIALVVPSVTNSVFADLVEGVGAVAGERGFSVLLGQLRGEPRELAKLLGEGRVDGAILQRPETLSDEALAEQLGVALPVVLFNSRLPERTGSVVLDDAAAARTAVQHLAGLGHSRIALIGGDERHDAARRRRAGFEGALAGAGLVMDPRHVVAAGWEAPAGAEAMAELLPAVAAGDGPTAVVVASVNAALGAMGAAARYGIDIPGRLSIVSVQDSWPAAAIAPALTVVRMPMRAAGARAAAMLLDVVDGSSSMTDEIVDDPAPTLIPRDSTAPPHR